MPRIHPLPAREREVSQRLKRIRLELKMSRVEFGRRLNLDSSALANLEHGRMRLRFYVAMRLGEQFGASMKWLAEGTGHTWGYQPVHDTMSDDGRPFTQVYDEVVGPQLARRASLSDELSMLRTYAKFPRAIGSPGEESTNEAIRDDLRNELSRMLGDDLKAQVRLIPPGLRSALRLVVLKAVGEFIGSLNSGQTKLHKTQNKPLHDADDLVKKTPMEILLPGLLAGLRKATAKRGAKSALANDLGVPLSSLSQWLKGKREPGGAITLRLLNWLGGAGEGNQQKSPPARQRGRGTRPDQ